VGDERKGVIKEKEREQKEEGNRAKRVAGKGGEENGGGRGVWGERRALKKEKKESGKGGEGRDNDARKGNARIEGERKYEAEEGE